jgi:AhpC/TSA family
VVQRIRWLIIVLLLASLPALAAGPDVWLKGFDGKDHNVNEYVGQGKWTIVVVWSKDCPICKRDIYHMTFFYDEHHRKDATVLGLSIDGYANRALAQGFIDDQSLNFPNLIGGPDDPSRISGTAFIGTPTYYFFSPDGKFMTQRIGPVTQEQAEAILHGLEKRNPAAQKI